MSPGMGKILFFVMLVFLAVALYATAAFAITEHAAIWAVLSVGALVGLWSYWRTWHKK